LQLVYYDHYHYCCRHSCSCQNLVVLEGVPVCDQQQASLPEVQEEWASSEPLIHSPWVQLVAEGEALV
jgi:hypothetical protein